MRDEGFCKQKNMQCLVARLGRFAKCLVSYFVAAFAGHRRDATHSLKRARSRPSTRKDLGWATNSNVRRLFPFHSGVVDAAIWTDMNTGLHARRLGGEAGMNAIRLGLGIADA